MKDGRVIWRACLGVAALLLAAGVARAQQTPGPARQEVLDNLGPHPAPEQPIPYSHKTHLAVGLECKDCHTNPEPGGLMAFPATSKCMQCHVTTRVTPP